jgi:hypothetical protein
MDENQWLGPPKTATCRCRRGWRGCVPLAAAPHPRGEVCISDFATDRFHFFALAYPRLSYWERETRSSNALLWPWDERFSVLFRGHPTIPSVVDGVPSCDRIPEASPNGVRQAEDESGTDPPPKRRRPPISTPELAVRYLFQSLFRIPCRIGGEKNKPLPTAKLVGFCCSCSRGPQPTSI